LKGKNIMLTNLQQWFANNLILVSGHYFFGDFNVFYSNQTLWIINPKDIEEFKRQNEAANERYNLGTTKEGQEYITSTYGLILVGEVDIKTDTFTYDVYKVLKVELSKSLGYLSGHFKNNMGDQSTKKLMATHAEKVKQRAKQEARSQAYLKKIADLKAEILAMSKDDGFKDLVDLAFSLDHSYDYTDDINVWRRGNDARKMAEKKFTDFGLDGKVLMDRIIKTHCS
jgi:hypothetical protein